MIYRLARKKNLKAEINVVPYIDVMLVLLIIFMVLSPLLIQGVEVNLPQTDTTKMSIQDEPLVISIDKNGNYFINVGEESLIIDLDELKRKSQIIFEANPEIEVVFQSNLLFEDTSNKKQEVIKEISKSNDFKEDISYNEAIPEKSISFDSLIKNIKIDELLVEEELISNSSQDKQIELYSSLIIQTIQSAWRKPINLPNDLVCDLRLSINKNGRIINVNLIKSSGNLRFDNSAIKAVQRVETFSFLKNISFSLYNNNFRNIVITFNPS